MGVDFTKRIVTGALYYKDELKSEFLDDQFDNPEKYDKDMDVFALDPYDTHEDKPQYIVGIIEKELEGSGDRAVEGDEYSVKETQLNVEHQKKVQDMIEKYNLPDKPVKTYKLEYFT